MEWKLLPVTGGDNHDIFGVSFNGVVPGLMEELTSFWLELCTTINTYIDAHADHPRILICAGRPRECQVVAEPAQGTLMAGGLPPFRILMAIAMYVLEDASASEAELERQRAAKSAGLFKMLCEAAAQEPARAALALSRMDLRFFLIDYYDRQRMFCLSPVTGYVVDAGLPSAEMTRLLNIE